MINSTVNIMYFVYYSYCLDYVSSNYVLNGGSVEVRDKNTGWETPPSWGVMFGR